MNYLDPDTQHGEVVIYRAENGSSCMDVRLEGETVWLTQTQLVDLYQTSKSNISEHIKHIFQDEELDENSVVRNIRTTAADGKAYNTRYYNLQMVLAIGYRVRSNVGVHFRNWASSILTEYSKKGFAMNDERLKSLGGGDYWKELLDRIRDIRSSEKVMYRQVLDLYATSIDYDPRSDASVQFFKIVQNKLHYAAHGHTAAEVIYERADATKPFMGLTSFSGELPVAKDVVVAKNYLSPEELKVLNNLVSGYFDFAEIQAVRHNPMHMADYVKHLDAILSSTGEQMLTNAGKISHEQATQKAMEEYRKYQATAIPSVEEAYLQTIREAEKVVRKSSMDK